MSHNIFTSVAPFWIQPQPQPVIIQQPAVHIHHIPNPVPNLAAAFKPKTAGSKSAHVVFVLDDSASMGSIRDLMISAFNEYVAGQKLGAIEKNVPTFVTLYKFDGRGVTRVYSRMPVDQVPALSRETYKANGSSTNLYDALGGALIEVNNDLAKLRKAQRDSIIIGILTDGQENSSHVFTSQAIKQMVEKSEAANWGFQFFGANINAYDVGSTLGFRVENTMQFDVGSVEATMKGATRMAIDMKAAYAMGMDTASNYAATAFTAAERTASIGGDND